jgi:aryl-alcohol dehydrogenase-like predicted oxidoreductase
VVPLNGQATPAGTELLQHEAESTGRVAPGHFRAGPGKLQLSSLGLGTYLGRPDAPTDYLVEEAVNVCLRSQRVNVIDTAINYRFQRAERSVGRALGRLVSAGVRRRDEFFVATKVGYLAPDAEGDVPVDEWVARHLVDPGIIDRDDIVEGSHCMTPTYLEDQVRRSLSNLQLETVDLLYLHNAPDAQLPVVGRTEFLLRLRNAFAVLERLRSERKIASYGLATWESLRTARTDPGFLSLEEAVSVAKDVGGEAHGFRYIQFPFNLAMAEAAVLRNQCVGSDRVTLFESAHRLGIACMTSVPLAQGQLARGGPARERLTSASTALQFVRSFPGNQAALVGQKHPEHLAANLSVAELPLWDRATVESLLS